MSKRYEISMLRDYGDNRSSMCVIEAEKEIPFKIARLFYDFYSKNETEPRGNHANLNSKFAFISIAGQCTVSVDDGENREDILLDTPRKMLVVDSLVWKKMTKFSHDSVLLVISDCVYDKNEYINDYNAFLQLVREK